MLNLGCLGSTNIENKDQEYILFKDIQYASIDGVDPKFNSLDIYTKETDRLMPIIIYVHGGAWRTGDKRFVGTKPNVFLDNNFLFVSVNYRLSPYAKFPAHVEDIAKAVMWIYENSEFYGGDKNHIYLMGHSAGAHLVTLLSTDERYLKDNNLELNIIKGVVALDTVYDINLLAETYGELPGAYIQTFGYDPEFWKFSSPINYVNVDKDIPPMMIVYSGGGIVGGMRDRDKQSEIFITKLEDSGVYTVIYPAIDKSHLDINIDFGQPDDQVTANVIKFLKYIQMKE